MAKVVFGDFEWDDLKAAANIKKHGVSFEEAITALADPMAVGAPDLVFPQRWITIGRSALLRVLFVVHTESLLAGRVRIISARKASATQRRKYDEPN
ncbi:MAG: BrnT family toxin [Deltaproteobacteria bacterium]|nr:BrnT family toxin [Deltaproteobacteria bacterium]